MKQQSLTRLVAAACILCATSAGAVAAPTAKQSQAPARWMQGDSTEQQRLGILKKEIGAAYAEQTAACKRGAATERTACMKQARATYDHDNANARQLVANAPQSSVTERVVSVTPAQDGASQPGASAYGNSAGGTTASGGMQSGGMQPGQMQSGQGVSGGQPSGMNGSGTMPPGGQMAQPAPSGYPSSSQMNTQPGMRSDSGAYGNSAGGTTGSNQGGAVIDGPQQSGSQNGNASQSGMSGTGTTQPQSMGAGTGATRSDMQGQSGTVPPVQR